MRENYAVDIYEINICINGTGSIGLSSSSPRKTHMSIISFACLSSVMRRSDMKDNSLEEKRKHYRVESKEDFLTGKLLIKAQAPRKWGEEKRLLCFAQGKFIPIGEGHLLPYISLPPEGQEEIIDGLIKELKQQKKRIAERKQRPTFLAEKDNNIERRPEE
jgi:hypothetical protein